jgi:hypothetical protein
MAIRIQLRRDTSANWASSNPVLRAGEIGIETDTLKFKIGNGSAAWNSITAYANVVPSDLNTTLGGYLEVTDIGDSVAGLNGSQNLLIPNDSIIFEGATADAHELTLQATDPTADRTIILPDRNGTVITTGDTGTVTNTMLAGSIANNKLTNSSVTINGYEIALGASATYGTDNISEGTTNLYFTNERAQDAVATALSNGTHTNITVTYNDNANSISLTGAQTYSDEMAQDAVAAALAAGTHTNITVSYNDNSNSISLTGAQTYSDENAQDAVGNAVGNGLDYDDTTGAISVDPSEFALSAIGVPTADVSLNSNKITNLATPTNSTDAATKSYVDGVSQGLHIHQSARAATATNVNISTELEPGDIIDGVTLAENDRVLVKSQTNSAQNGIYVVQSSGAALRASDFNEPIEVDGGDFVFVNQGTLYADTGWVQVTDNVVTIGTDPIVFTQFSGAGTYLAGTGLTLTGNTFSINTGTTVDLSTAQTLTNKTINLSSNTISGTLAEFNTAVSNADLASLAGAETLTNKTINGANNTLTVRLANDVSGTLPVANGGTGITAFGTGVATALGVNVGSSGAFVTNGGALGTPSSATLTNATGLPVSGIISSTTQALGLGSIELGHASDTTIARSDAGVITVEGVVVPTISSTNTLTNKTINLASNTLSGTLAEFNTALSNADFATLAGTETLTNKVIGVTSTTTINTNSATTVDTTALNAFTTIKYLVSIKQGSKIRSSQVIAQTDGTSVDYTEFGVVETGGPMNGILVAATTSSTNCVLQVTITDAASTNATVKIQEVLI